MSEQLTPEVVERIEVLRSALATYTATEIDKAEFNSLIYSNTPALLAAVRERDVLREQWLEAEQKLQAHMNPHLCPDEESPCGQCAECVILAQGAELEQAQKRIASMVALLDRVPHSNAHILFDDNRDCTSCEWEKLKGGAA